MAKRNAQMVRAFPAPRIEADPELGLEEEINLFLQDNPNQEIIAINMTTTGSGVTCLILFEEK